MNKLEKFITWCDKAMAFSFYALIYFLPISIALSETFTGTALLFYLLKRGAMFYGEMKSRSSAGIKLSFWRKGVEFLKAFKPIKNYLNWPIAIFLFFNIISVVFSQHQGVSFEGFLGKSLQSAFLYFNFIECINSRKRLKIFLTAFFISSMLICTNGLYQRFIGQGFIHGHLVHDGRISSSFRTHNDFAGYLVSIAPMLLSLFLLTIANGFKKHPDREIKDSVFKIFLSKRGRIFIFALLVLSFFCLGFTLSRGAWIAFALSLLFIGFRGKKNMVICVLILGLFLGIFHPKLRQQRHVGLLSDPLSTQEKKEIEKLSAKTGEQGIRNGQKSFIEIQLKKVSIIYSNFSGSGRMGYWREACNMIKDYPVVGVGLNTYSIVGRGYKINWGGYPHNCYLQMAVEIGIVGLLSFLWIVFVIFRKSIKNLKRINSRFLHFLLLGVLAGHGGFLIHSFFDTNFYSVQLGSLMWLLMGLIVAIQKIELDAESIESTIA